MSFDSAHADHQESIAILREEIDRLAHASPPPPGRDDSVRVLKAAIAALLEDERGVTRWRYHAAITFRVVGSLALLFPIFLAVMAGIRTARGQPLPWEANPNYWKPLPLFVIVIVAFALGDPVWQAIKGRRRVRRAKALAAQLHRTDANPRPN